MGGFTGWLSRYNLSVVSIAAPLPATRPSERAATASPFIVSPLFDTVFFLASSLVVFLPWLAAEKWHASSWTILAAVGVASNGPHLASTWTRVYLHRGDFRRRLFNFFWVPFFICAFVGAVVAIQGPASELLRSILFYYASYHFVQQNWGLLRIYQRKQGEPSMMVVRLERATLYLGTAYCMLHRLRTGPWQLFGANVWHPTPPVLVVDAVGLCLAATFAGVLAIRIVRATQGRAADAIRPLFLASSFLGFAIPFLFIRSDGTSAFAAAAAWHGIQYIGIVWHFNRRRYGGKPDPEAPVVSYISQPGRAVLYGVTLLAMAGLAYVALYVGSVATNMNLDDFGVIGWTTLTFSHYYLDGVIWKLRKSENAVPLGLAPSPR
jgi:hypothetical protein